MDDRTPPLPVPCRDAARQRDDLLRHGYCLVESALAAGELRDLQRRLFAQAAAERALHALKNPANRDARNQWVGMLLNKGEVFARLLDHERPRELVATLLGERHVLSCMDAQIQHPGAGQMPLHTDQWWMPPPQRPGEPHLPPADIVRDEVAGSVDPSPAAVPIAPVACCNVMWLVTDFTEANGATRVVPGSHLSGRQPSRALPHPLPTVAAAAPAGTALVFDGRLWHGAGANASEASRFAVTMNFCGPQFRLLENYTRGLRPDVAARLPAATLERIGFATWSSYGHTGDPDARVVADGGAALGPIGDDVA